MARGGERLQLVGVVAVAVGVGLFVGALLGLWAGVGVALFVSGCAAVVVGFLKEREVTDGASPPVVRT